MLYQIRDLEFSYLLEKQKITALDKISVNLPKHCFLGLSGPSGSGKTTLLNLLGLIEPMQKGQLEFEGKDLGTLKESEKNQLRRHKIGFVFQTFNLLPVLNAEENVEYFLVRQGVSESPRKVRVRNALEAVGLWEHRKKRPLEMSGGQRQRVALARALAKQPEVIIADEPTASLDQKNGREIMKIFTDLNQNAQVAIIVASHDAMVQSYCKTRLHLIDGKIVSSEGATS